MKQNYLLIAHRGWSKYFPENSLAAFSAAIAVGADEIEFDVRLSKDNIPFICHDTTVDRTSNLQGPCDSFTIEELKNADIHMPESSQLKHMGFPTLQQVLSMFGGHIGLNIHIKEDKNEDIILDLISQYPFVTQQKEKVYIAGNAKVLQTALEKYSFITRCCLAAEANDPDQLIANAIKYKCTRLQFNSRTYTKKHVDKALTAGLMPNLFYADEPKAAENAINKGIIGLLTNDIGLIYGHLEK